MQGRLRRRAASLATLLLLGFAATAPAQSWTSPLSAYWPMYDAPSQQVRDHSGQGNHGQLGRLPGADARDAEWVTGLFGVGSAIRLDGNDFVQIPDSAVLRSQRLTVEAWVRRSSTPGKYKYVFVKGGDKCEAGSYGLYSSYNGGMAFYVYNGSTFHRSPSVTQDIWDGKWHHVAGTYDGQMVRLFVDGYQVGSGRAYSGKVEYNLENKTAYIGAYRGACNLTMSADVDEVRVWNTALSVDRIWYRIRDALHLEPAAPLPEEAEAWKQEGTAAPPAS